MDVYTQGNTNDEEKSIRKLAYQSNPVFRVIRMNSYIRIGYIKRPRSERSRVDLENPTGLFISARSFCEPR